MAFAFLHFHKRFSVVVNTVNCAHVTFASFQHIPFSFGFFFVFGIFWYSKKLVGKTLNIFILCVCGWCIEDISTPSDKVKIDWFDEKWFWIHEIFMCVAVLHLIFVDLFSIICATNLYIIYHIIITQREHWLSVNLPSQLIHSLTLKIYFWVDHDRKCTHQIFSAFFIRFLSDFPSKITNKNRDETYIDTPLGH